MKQDTILNLWEEFCTDRRLLKEEFFLDMFFIKLTADAI